MNFGDIFRKTFLDTYNTGLSLKRMILTLCITLALSFFVFVMYRLTVRDIPFSKSFAVSMCMVSVVTAGIILAVQSSIVISLGMVGALSIVRFRTAIKNPMDLLFLFWSISIGIITGAGLYLFSLGTCLVIAAGLIIYQIIPLRKAPHLLIVRCTGDASEDEVMRQVGKSYRRHKVKSRSMVGLDTELVIELQSLKNEAGPVRAIRDIDGVTGVTMLSHDGQSVVQ
ncbi:MAG: DUF4956 domain-containing protein [Clostridiales bacterium]|nr:DUF4956 domain-containing protein [Clostridiales bacterium]